MTDCTCFSGEKRIERSEIEMDITAMDGPVPKKAKGEKFKNIGKPKMKQKHKNKGQLAKR